jgi:ubiquinone/menaquinone biosynthesis C-methylase UbiE
MLNLDKQERARQRYRAMKPGYRPALEIYSEWLAEQVGSETRLLDAGCGPGGLVKGYLTTARMVIGVDRYATAFYASAEIPVLIESDLNRLPFPNASFHVITCSWVLEHLQTPDKVFSEFARVLKPGGHLLLITPNKSNYVVWLRRVVPNLFSKRIVKAIYARDEHFINPTYYRANTLNDIDRLMRAAGLRRQRFEHVSDPTYLAITEWMFRISVLIENILGRIAPQTRVHLVGMYQKPTS